MATFTYCWGYSSFADCVKSHRAQPSKHAWSFFGQVPKIVVSSPEDEKRRLRFVRRSQKKAAIQPSSFIKEVAPWLKSFLYMLDSRGVILRGRVVDRSSPMHLILRAQKAFRQKWVYEHNPKKEEVKGPVISPTLTGRIWHRDPEPTKDRWNRESASSDEAQSGTYCGRVAPARSIELLAKLKYILLQFNIRRKTKFIRRICNLVSMERFMIKHKDLLAQLKSELAASLTPRKRVVVKPEMDRSDAHGENDIVEDIAQNVVLQSHAIDSAASPPLVNTIKMKQWAGEDVETDYSALTNRWTRIKTVQWKGTVSQGKEIISLDLPYDMFVEATATTSGTDCGLSTPAHTPFELYRYWHGDLDIKIQVNGNKFQQGQLIAAWFYAPSIDSKFALRDNIHSCSQTNNCLIDAAESNDAILHIPYKSFRPKLPTKYRKDMGTPLLLGRLKVMVMNPLLLGTGTTSEASVSVYIKYSNSSFSGMVNRDVGKVNGEMFPITAMVAMKYLYNEFSDRNRDNPPLQQCVIQNVPQTAQSFCLANSISEPIQALRLDASGQTPHPEGQTDEMMIDHVVRTYGYVRTLSWGKESTGSLLGSFDASPMFNVERYAKTVLESSNCYYLPPVAVISNLFAFWRGSLELRIDIVATQYHTGRLMVVYIPGHLGDVTMCQAQGSHYQVYDLRESRQFTMKIPYIADRPWWPRRYDAGVLNDEQLPPGKVHIFVANQLVSMPNISTTVALNCYWRAGEDFELSIPVQPSIGLSFNPKTNAITHNDAWARDGYFPYYIGSWASFQGGTRAVLRYGPVTQHIAQFNRLKYDQFYTPPGDYNNELTFKLSSGSKVAAKYFLPIDVGDGYGYIYLACCANRETLVKVYTETKAGVKKLRDKPDYSQLAVLGSTTDNPYLPAKYGNMLLAGNDISSLLNDIKDSFVYVEIGEANKSVASIQVLPSTPTTASGLHTFGEKFNDLKTLCRRYEAYSIHEVKLDAKTKIGAVHIRLPLVIQGLDFDIINNKIRNNLRDGVIATIASGYRFFRGGMRLRIVVNTPGLVGMWVEHRAERRLFKLSPQTSVTHNIDDVYNFGYAMAYQNTFINNVLTLEIPFYQPGSLGLLQRPYLDKNEITSHISLGDLTMGFHCELGDKNLALDIATFYCLADDCRFIEFQGFPPMLLTKEIAFDKTKQVVRPQMDTNSDFCFPQMKFDLNVKHTINKPEATQTIIKPGVNESVDSTPFYKSANFYHGITYLISQLMHVLVGNPIYNGLVALVSILMQLGIVAFSNFKTILEAFINLLKSWGISTEQKVDAPVKAQGFFDSLGSKDYAVIVGTCLSGMCAAGKIADMKVNSVSSFAKILSNGMVELSRGGFFIMRFFENVFELIGKLAIYIRNRSNPHELLHYIKENNQDLVKVWADEAETLLHPDNEEKIMTCQTWFEKLDIAYNVGASLSAAATISDKSHTDVRLNSHAIMTIQSRLHQLRAQAATQGLVGVSRMEPWCIWMFGPAGLGKSHIAGHVANECLNEANIPRYGDFIYVHAARNNFEDGLVNQPVYLFDDYNCVDDNTNEDHNIFMKLNSCAPFTPNQAKLEHKGRRYAPSMVYVNANHGFVNEAAIKDKDAYHRRRHMLVEFVLKPGAIPAHIQVRGKEAHEVDSQAILDSLYFMIHYDPMDPLGPKSALYEYKDFIKIAKTNFRQHTDRARAMYLERVRSMTMNAPEVDPFIPLSTRLSDIAESLKTGKNATIVQSPLQKYLAAINTKPIEKEEVKVAEPQPSTSSVAPQMDNNSTPPIVDMEDQIHSEEQDALPPTPPPSEILEPIIEIMPVAGTSKDKQSIKKKEKVAVVTKKKVIPVKTLVFKPSVDTDGIPLDLASLISMTKNTITGPPTNSAFVASPPTQVAPIIPVPVIVDSDEIRRSDKLLFSNIILRREEEREINIAAAVSVNAFNMKTQEEKYPSCLHTFKHLIGACFDAVSNKFYTKDYKAIPNKPCVDGCQMQDSVEKEVMLSNLKSQSFVWSEFYRYSIFQIADSEITKFWYIERFVSPFRAIYDILHKPVEKCVLRRGWDALIDFLCNHIKMILGTLSLFVAGAMTYMHSKKVRTATTTVTDFVLERYASLRKKFKESFATMTKDEVKEMIKLQGEIQSSGDTNKVIKISKTTGITPKTLVSSQMLYEKDAKLEGVLTNITKNTFFLVIHGTDRNTGERVRDIGRCVGIAGNWAVIPFHYKTRIDSLIDVTIDVVRLHSAIEISPVQLRWQRLKDCELSIVKVPASVGYFKDIRRLFKPVNEIQNCLSARAYFVEMSYDFRPNVDLLDIDVTEEMTMVSDDNTETLIDVITYNKHGNGKCGSVLVDPTNDPRIIGIHVAGGGSIGVAEPIVYETFKSLPGYEIVDCPELVMSQDKARIILDSNFTPVCITRPELAHSETGKTEIIPSLVAGVFPISTAPAPLSNKDPRLDGSPMKFGVEKHGKVILGFDKKDIEHAAEDYKNILFTFIRPIRLGSGRLPLYHNLNGIAGLPGYKKITYGTSEGFPFTAYRPPGSSNKRWLFKIKDTEVVGIHNHLREMLDYKQQQREMGLIPFTVFTDCLKDSRILAEKCSTPGKTRVFSISPIDYTIHFREYFLDFIAAFMFYRIKTEHAIGIACDSMEWTALARRINRQGPYLLDGDYSNFGPGLDLDCVEAFGDIIVSWYEKFSICTPLDSKVRKILILELMYSLHLCFNIIYRTHCGCPSGSPATVIINSGVNSLYIRMAWMYIFRDDPFMRTMDRFRRYVTFVTYGDDILMNVSSEVIHLFNNYTIQAFFKLHKIGYTDAKKGNNILPYSTFSEVTFLKRGFGLHPFRQHIFLAKLDKRFLEDIANWIVKSPDIVNQSKESSVMCCIQAFGHGIEYYNYIKNAIIEAWQELGYPISIRTWEQLDTLFIKEKSLYYDCGVSLENDVSSTDCAFSSLFSTN